MITLTNQQLVQLYVSALDGAGDNIPASPAPVWTVSDPTNVALSFPQQGNPNTVYAIPIGAPGTYTVTATSGILTQVFTLVVVAPGESSLTGYNDPVFAQNSLAQGRGRGLGLGYR